MPIKSFQNLRCWQLADQLRREVIAICATPAASRDFGFCDSFRDAAGSVCRNISEGFVRFTSPEIAKFFGYALASLAEVQDHLVECRRRNFVSEEDFKRLHDLSEHTKATSLNFSKPHRDHANRRRTRGRP